MSTDSQINANQQNSQHSTGPITEEGKAASSRNSFRHGLTASPMSMMPGESVENYIEFGNGLRTEHQPATMTEDALVTKMIESLWLSARAVRLQQKIVFDPAMDRKDFDLYMRYQKMHDRAFSKSLDDLIKLRKEALRLQKIGFVSQQQIQQVRESKIRHLNARSHALECTTQLRKSQIATPAPAPPTPRNEILTGPTAGETQQAA